MSLFSGGGIELAPLRAKVIADISDFKRSMSLVKSEGTKATDSLEDGFEDVSKKSEQSGGKVKSAFGGIAKAAVAAFSVKALVDFAKQAVNAAASAQAIDAQFSQTFGDLEGKAQDSVDALGKKFGMVPGRIKPAFAQTTAQFKGLGLDTEEAMKQAESATTIAADAAAFYDKSMEDAQGSLNSFIKGNYEGGEAIGLFANDSQMAAFAVKNGAVESTQAWSQLGEAQKQMIRLDFAEEMQNQAGATGQAARESESLENVTGNLKQSWSDFLAIIGKPILGVTVKVIKFMSDALSGLGERLKGTGGIFKGFFDPIKDGFTKVKDFAKGFTDALKPMFDGSMFSGGLESFNLLQKLGLSTETSQSIVKFILNIKNGFTDLVNGVKPVLGTLKTVFTNVFDRLVDVWNQLYPVLVPLFRNIFDYVGVFVKMVGGYLGVLWEKASEVFGLVAEYGLRAFDLLKQYILPIILDIVKFFSDKIGMLVDFWNQNGQQLLDAVRNVFDIMIGIIKPIFESILNIVQKVMPVVAAIIKTVWATIKNIISGALDVIMGLVKVFTGLFTGDWSKMWEGIKQVLGGAVKILTSGISAMWEGIKNFFVEGVKNVISKVTGFVDNIKHQFEMFKKKIGLTIHLLWQDIKNRFDNGVSTVKNTVSGFVDKIKSFFTNLKNGVVNIAKAIWQSIKDRFSNGASSVKDTFSSFVNKIRDFFNNLKTKLTDTANAIWTSIKDVFKKGYNFIASGVEAWINGLIYMFEGLANGIKNGIVNAVNGVIKGINWILEKISSDITIDEVKINDIKIGRVSLPKFAQGTLGLPSDTLGVVNDQRGANYEELIIPPSGNPFIAKGRDAIVPMQAGTQILPAGLTKQFKEFLPHFKGGFFSSAWETVKGVASNVKDVVSDVWEYATNPGKLVELAIDKFTDLGNIGGIGLDLLQSGFKYLTSKITDFVKNIFDTSAPEADAGGGGKAWTDVIKSVAARMQVNLTDHGLNTIIKRINQESGGSETVMNTWDINWKRGTPSIGLLQYIEPTFRNWFPKGFGYPNNIRKGISQIAAMFNDSNWLQDISRKGGWGPTGRRRFPVDGSHRDGLSFVPWDGYNAQLHRGERVLTAEENRQYSAANRDMDKLSAGEKKIIQLLTLIAGKDSKVVIDKNALVNCIDEEMGHRFYYKERGHA